MPNPTIVPGDSSDEAAPAPLEADVYLVINDRWGPVASGSKEACLSYVVTKLGEQSEMENLVNPSGYRLAKVRQL